MNEIPHQKKLKVRAALNAAENLDHTYVVVGPYADGEPGLAFGANRMVKEAGTFDTQNKEAVLIGDGNFKVSYTTMKEYVPYNPISFSRLMKSLVLASLSFWHFPTPKPAAIRHLESTHSPLPIRRYSRSLRNRQVVNHGRCRTHPSTP